MGATTHCLKTRLNLCMAVSVLLNFVFILSFLLNSRVHLGHLGRSLYMYNSERKPYRPSNCSKQIELKKSSLKKSVLNLVTQSVSIHNSMISKAHYTLAVMITTAPTNLAQRDIVRQTWINGYEEREHFARFIIGTKNMSKELTLELEKEYSKHHDLLLLPEVEDGYKNLPHKVLAGMVWFDRNVDYSYLLKCDDDTFALLDKIENELQARNSSKPLYWGYFLRNNNPKPTGKWAEQNWKLCDLYFPYAMGGGYVLSANIVNRIAHGAEELIVYSNEDVSVGTWTAVYDVEQRHDERFSMLAKIEGCNFLLITTDHIKEGLKEKHKHYLESKELCIP